MINNERALKIAKEYLAKRMGHLDLRLAENRTREEDFGWVFIYNLKSVIEEGDSTSRLVGNSPLVVDRETGEIITTGTRFDIDHYIMLYKKNRGDIAAFKDACLR